MVDRTPPSDDEIVHDVLHAAAQYLMGRGAAPDIDSLDPRLRDRVDDLLPVIVELVGDRIVEAGGQGG